MLSVLLPAVVSDFQRHGIGHALMEAGVTQAEALGITHLRTATANNSRPAHRFMARLALSPSAVLRTAPTQVVRAKLAAQRPRSTAAAKSSLSSLLAQRRSQRRRTDAG
ncbi:GNAT family N-acetyltransferase [Nocardioides alcanivorans]|uniref:GNAT family N-acetyltransferase n=1 Tax=Nocardioides alcanivorans TaxID=2897352 RepID=UPI001F18CC6E|nr:GNAT family N-acetyltransferase [Nocardioides alcanivorans]